MKKILYCTTTIKMYTFTVHFSLLYQVWQQAATCWLLWLLCSWLNLQPLAPLQPSRFSVWMEEIFLLPFYGLAFLSRSFPMF